MKLRDDLARQNDEGPTFVAEDALMTHLIKQASQDLNTAVWTYYQCKYMPFYIEKS